MYNFQEQELNKAQVQLLMSQIQPHFLFNALSAISNTYRSDPMKAADAIDDFSNYLRGNIKSIGSNNKILFKEELKHVNYYLNLEKLRFGDEIEVIYDINNVNFYVPTLTIEPLVENSIKHGLNRKHSKGYVKIAAYSEGNNNVIQIEDNGAGFDINSLDENDNDHIGIKNARKRIELISKGTLSIESKINYGTKITIKIPKGGK